MPLDASAEEVRGMLRLAAEPVRPGELVVAQIRRAAQRCRLPVSRVRKLWYGEAVVSLRDFLAVTAALGGAADRLAAYQDAKALLLREQLGQALGRTPPGERR